MQYNELGQEIQRMLPGDVVSRWQYDAAGRPVDHRVLGQVRGKQQDLRRRRYDWDINDRLRKITNGLTGNHIEFTYDALSNLVRAEHSRIGDILHRSVDDVGNLYETRDRTDRIYGAGSRLEKSKVNTNELKNEFQGGYGKLVTKGTEFRYDEEGNMIRKIKANGDVWEYEYYGSGMLSKVVRSDKSEVTFKYDPLGRRIEKRSPEKTVSFIWDGNNPLHEWEEDNDLVTWVFNDDFVPSAKLTKEGNYSIITDYIGTPVEVYDTEGERIWFVELDIFGRVKEYTGDIDFIPFRYQGQYHDEETNLYYNRFRYYDPEAGIYTQQDPVGLVGDNPTLYAYVRDTNAWIDPFGLRECPLWKAAREAYWKTIAKAAPRGQYSSVNMARMRSGLAPQIKVREIVHKTGEIRVRNVSLELHHKWLPQRGISPSKHLPANLEIVTPWEHAAGDAFRYPGTTLIKVLKDVGNFMG
jgi:RHS repeat-associated protein